MHTGRQKLHCKKKHHFDNNSQKASRKGENISGEPQTTAKVIFQQFAPKNDPST